MAHIFESRNFDIQSEEYPLVDRNDGGHITINPKVKISTRQQLSAELAIELMRLTIVVGEAMTIVMNMRGVDIERINYQDNGNWSVFKPEGPLLHIHLYGRARSAIYQKYGQSLYFPHKDENGDFYKNLSPLTNEDVLAMREQIVVLFKREKYSDEFWRLG